MSNEEVYKLEWSDIIVNFELNQVFCGCNIEPNIHDYTCPNFGIKETKPSVNIHFIMKDEKTGERIKVTTATDNLIYEKLEEENE